MEQKEKNIVIIVVIILMLAIVGAELFLLMPLYYFGAIAQKDIFLPILVTCIIFFAIYMGIKVFAKVKKKNN